MKTDEGGGHVSGSFLMLAALVAGGAVMGYGMYCETRRMWYGEVREADYREVKSWLDAETDPRRKAALAFQIRAFAGQDHKLSPSELAGLRLWWEDWKKAQVKSELLGE